VDRRTFITWSAGGGLMLALGPALGSAWGAEEQRAASAGLSPWIAIAPDGRVTLVSTVSEMGQGSRTGQAQILADELDVAWDAIEVVMAPDRAPFALPDEGLNTGGSESIRTRFDLLRAAGASARAQLVAAAARRWGAAPLVCEAALGQVTHKPSGRVLSYGALAAEAAAIPPPADPPLKDRAAWRYIGKTVKPLNLAAKCTGEARYGVDTRIPGMARATVRQCPAFGGTLASVDPAPALAVAGVRRVVKLPDAVAVVADTTWAAFQGAKALEPKWNAPASRLSSRDLRGRLAAGLDAPGAEAPVSMEGADAAAMKAKLRAQFAGGGRVIEAAYESPYLAHCTMEPMNATARVTAGKVEIWAPCQDLTATRADVAKALGRPPGQIELNVTLLGGGYGRRLETDYAVQAALIARAHGGPVQLVWRREEDMAHDHYRPASLNRFRAVLGPDGLIGGYEIVGATTDGATTDGAGPAPYALPLFANTQTKIATGVPAGYWRSVDPGIILFGRESFIDECAAAAGRDPLDYRRALLGDNARARRVLDAAANAIGWSGPQARSQTRGEGPRAGVGLALMHSWNTVICHAVAVEVEGKTLSVKRIVVAGDCGTAVNPGQVKAQWEGGCLMGLSAALQEGVTFTNGAADQANFDSYPLLRHRQATPVEVLLFDSPGVPVGGVGEPPVPGVAPALANAIFAATGERVRSLPLKAAGWKV
jgi:isoquinoline 1-oxidoreductase beta subunit